MAKLVLKNIVMLLNFLKIRRKFIRLPVNLNNFEQNIDSKHHEYGPVFDGIILIVHKNSKNSVQCLFDIQSMRNISQFLIGY